MANLNTWYVIADGGKARIATLSGGHMHALHHFDNSGHGDAAQDPSAGTSQLKAPKSDPHDQAKAHFATQIAHRLNEAVRTGEVDEIVLAAPGHILHDIREALDKAATGKLIKSISKDLTNTPEHELAGHFS